MPVHPSFSDQVDKPLQKDQVWAVIICPTNEGGADLYRLTVSIPHHAWVTSPVSKRCGFGLQLAQWQHRETVLPNISARTLFLESDRSNPGFGKVPAEVLKGWSGEVVAIRSDGQDIHEQQVKSLLTYMVNNIGDHITSLQNLSTLLARCPPDEVKYHDALTQRISTHNTAIDKLLSPGAYHSYYTQWKDFHISQGLEELRGLRSPVEMTLGEDKIPHVCAACEGSMDKMQKCVGCGEVWYCDKGCQASIGVRDIRRFVVVVVVGRSEWVALDR